MIANTSSFSVLISCLFAWVLSTSAFAFNPVYSNSETYLGCSELADLSLDNIQDTNCNPGFYAVGSTCLPCPPGTYCPGDGISYPCAAGTYQNASGEVVCFECLPGSFSGNTGATECESCPSGTYQSTYGSSQCFDCPMGTISDPGSTSCTTCEPGYYVVDNECQPCPPGTYCPDGVSSILCASGTYQSMSGQVFCYSCPAGTFSGEPGSEGCELCPAGTYQSSSGAAQCYNCPSGTISDTGATDCTTCSPGYYVVDNECQLCPPGTYCPDGVSSIPCVAGTIQPLSGQILCNSCPAGSFSGAGSTSCELCPAGTYQSSAGSGGCIDCPLGTISESGSTSCTTCSPGYYVVDNECQLCPPGTYCPDGVSSIPCVAGTIQPLSGQILCNSCPAGSFSGVGSTSCELCPAGTYQSSAGSGGCIDCADGFSSEVGAVECEQVDCSGQIGGSAYIDECGICDDNAQNDNETCIDCLGVVNGDAVPGSPCAVASIVGVFDADCICDTSPQGEIDGYIPELEGCNDRDISLAIYVHDNTSLSYTFNSVIDSNGEFDTPPIPEGNYDIYITVEGYLTKLYSDVEIGMGANEFNFSGFLPGDLNNSNGVNVVDVSAMGAAFGYSEGDIQFSSIADYNCDGFINIVDISILIIGFGLSGDVPPEE